MTIKTLYTSLLFLIISITSFSQNLKEVNTIINDGKEITTANITPDNKFIICGFKTGEIIVYETLTGKIAYELNRHKGEIYSISFDKKGKYFVSACLDRSAIVWSINSGKQLKSFTENGDAVWTAEFTPDNKYIVTGGTDQVISVWELISTKRYRTLWGHKDRVYSLKVTKKGDKVYSVSGDNSIKVWDISKQLLLKTINSAHTNDITSIALSSDETFFVTGAKDNTVKIWDFNTFDELATMRGHMWHI